MNTILSSTPGFQDPDDLNARAPEKVIGKGFADFFCPVLKTNYSMFGKPGRVARTMRVDYCTESFDVVSEWVNVEFFGYARNHAISWWAERCAVPLPYLATEAVRLANAGYLRVTTGLTVRAFEELAISADSQVPRRRNSSVASDA